MGIALPGVVTRRLRGFEERLRDLAAIVLLALAAISPLRAEPVNVLAHSAQVAAR